MHSDWRKPPSNPLVIDATPPSPCADGPALLQSLPEVQSLLSSAQLGRSSFAPVCSTAMYSFLQLALSPDNIQPCVAAQAACSTLRVRTLLPVWLRL